MHGSPLLNLDLFNNGPIVAFIWKNEPGWPVETVSNNLFDMYGYDPKDYYSKKFSYVDHIHPDDLSRVSEEVISASNKPEITSVKHQPYRYLDNFGKYHWVKDTCSIVRSDNGDITHFIGYLIDMTDEMEFQEETNNLKKRYQAILEFASDGIFIMDLDGAVIECSQRAAQDLGYSMEEMKNLHVYDWDVSHTKEVALEHVRNTPSDAPISFETRHRRKDGKIYDASITAVKIQIMNNNYIYASVRDITQQKLLEHELLDKNKTLTNLAENIPGVIYTYQFFPDGRSCFPYASDHIFDIYGVRSQDVREDATKVFEVLHPEDIGHVAETITYSHENLTLWEDEYRIIHPKKGII